MEADTPTAQRWELVRERLDERQRRAFAAATSVARNTTMAGMQELKGLINVFVPGAALAPVGSTRRGGSTPDWMSCFPCAPKFLPDPITRHLHLFR
jgi:hypothetical protein